MKTPFCVPWTMFLRNFEPGELTDPKKVVSDFGDGLYCRLCDSFFSDSATTHIAQHERELEEHLALLEVQADEKRREAARVAVEERQQRRLDAVADATSGLYTLAEVAEQYGVRLATLKSWVKNLAGTENPANLALAAG